jgi:hygromycin-B 7''-O-kinase
MTRSEFPSPPAFASDDEYEASLRDAGFWEPYARAALRRTGLPDEGDVVMQFPTTHVSALVGGRYLVKLHYEEWFGEECFQTERAFYRATRGHALPIPDLLAEGALYEGSAWRWPFLVLSAMAGRDLRSRGSDVSHNDMEGIADFVGTALRRLHAASVAETPPLTHAGYVALIHDRMAASGRDHPTWRSLPERLASQVRDYVWERRRLVDPEAAPRSLIHGDLHGGNIFAVGSPGRLQPAGIVDFNDAMIGDPHYDLVSLHLKAFRADKALLRVALKAYGWLRDDPDWSHRMMALTLVHDYDMIEPVVSAYPGAFDRASTLEDVAERLWDLGTPGPAGLG